MAESNNSNLSASEPAFILERSFKAPRELVFAAWTEPEQFMQWWGPVGFTTPECRIDLRIGGRLVYCMRSPEGQDYWGGGIYSEIVPPERLVYDDFFCDKDGNKVEPSEYGMPAEWPSQTRNVVTFEDSGDGNTKLTLKSDVPMRIAKLVMADQGWGSSFDKLEMLLAGQV